MAKKKGNGYLLERPRTRLPDELAIRRRRDVVRMDNIPQIQTGINIEEIHAQTPPASLRRHGLSDSLLRIWNMVTEPRTRKNDSIGATQDATPHQSDEKKIQKN